MPSEFDELLRLIRDGEPVSAKVTNRAPEQLDRRLRRLRALLSTVAESATVVASNQLIEPAATVGMPVYYNASSQRFERAIGAVEVDTPTGAFIPSPSSQVWGVVRRKLNATTGDITLHGLDEISLAAALTDGETPIAGIYYLSNQVPGRLVRQRPPVGISVLNVGGTTPENKQVVFVNAKLHDLLESHRHYRFDLVAAPAGSHTPPSPGDPHEITDPDPELEGWLPADHAVFDGNAPNGAKFGYNLSASNLKNLWPPQPISGAHLELSRGGDGSQLAGGVPTGSEQLCVLDEHGIWWLSDCNGTVPWDPAHDTDSSVSEYDNETCPLSLPPQLTLWFSKPSFATNGAWVSSLQAKEGSGLTITCLDNNSPTAVGDLLIDLDLSLTVDPTPFLGHNVLKGIEDNRFLQGPVVSSIKGVGSNVVVSSNVVADVNGRRYGDIQIAFENDITAGELAVDTVRLSGVEEEFFVDVMALNFPNGRLASFRGRVNIPTGIILPDNAMLRLEFWVLNRSSNDIPAEIFKLTYRRLPRPDAPVSLPIHGSDVILSPLPAENVSVSEANQYVLLASEPFEVVAGDQVLFTMLRQGDTDGFNSQLFLLRQYGKYVEIVEE